MAILLFGAIILNLAFPDAALAATTTTTAKTDVLATAHTSISNLMKGSISKIIALVSLAFGLAGCAIRFNAGAIASCFGVSIAAGVGPGIVEALTGALF